MLPRFLAAIDPVLGTARLSEEEARHLSQVLRLRAGDEVAVFDGAGREFRARVEQIARDGASVRLIDEQAPAPEPLVRVTLAQAALKGEKMDDVVRDATMMGVAAIEPLVTEHTAAHLKAGRAPERWRRIAIASAKQCRRAVVPAIGEGMPFAEWIARDRAELKLLLVEPTAVVAIPAASEERGQVAFAGEQRGQVALAGAEQRGQVGLAGAEQRGQVGLAGAPPPASASLLIGPEGGWSAAEVSAAVAAGYVPLTLGRRTLRADAMPVVALSVLQYLWSDL
jgi:16S rRNA (uracil1498-N3)-methyltransferase